MTARHGRWIEGACVRVVGARAQLSWTSYLLLLDGWSASGFYVPVGIGSASRFGSIRFVPYQQGPKWFNFRTVSI
jgi:hypothetical protein